MTQLTTHIKENVEKAYFFATSDEYSPSHGTGVEGAVSATTSLRTRCSEYNYSPSHGTGVEGAVSATTSLRTRCSEYN